MNIETFNAIASRLVEDNDEFGVPAKLKALVDNLQNRINNPAEPSYQQTIDKQISELRVVLPKLRSNSFPPLWMEYLYEIGAQRFVGRTMLADIEDILVRNGITPTIAHKELKEILDDQEGDVAAFKASRGSLKRFGIGLDLPAPGTVELGVLIPRSSVHDGLSEFGAELRKLARIVGVFHECIHGDRPDPKLKSVASSEFSILCLLDWQTAKLIADGISALIEAYKAILSLKEKIQGLRDEGVPDKTLKGLVDHANEKMATTVSAITEEIITRYPDGRVQETRKKELKIEMRGALGEIATRIDKGFSFEIRPAVAAAPKEGTEEDAAAVAARELQHQQFAEISAKQRGIQYLKSDGPAILALPGLPEEAPKVPAPKGSEARPAP